MLNSGSSSFPTFAEAVRVHSEMVSHVLSRVTGITGNEKKKFPEGQTMTVTIEIFKRVAPGKKEVRFLRTTMKDFSPNRQVASEHFIDTERSLGEFFTTPGLGPYVVRRVIELES